MADDTTGYKEYASKQYVNERCVQPDWNAAEGEAGYIANKPFGKSGELGSALIEDFSTEINQQGSAGNYVVNPFSLLGLVNGETYTVVWDGISYVCQAVEDSSGYVCLGEDAYSFDTYPFYYMEDDSTVLLSSSTTGSHTISIFEGGIVYNQIDTVYIPNYDNLSTIGKPGTADYSEVFNNPTNEASGKYSHVEGTDTTASNFGAHAEGGDTTASGQYSHAEGSGSNSSGSYSHAEGSGTTASGRASHAEGSGTIASGDDGAHAEGSGTTASSSQAHAEGMSSTASAQGAHAEGYGTIAASMWQHAQGKYNVEDAADVYAHIVGNGTDNTSRSNAHTVDWDGNAWYAGTVKVGGTSYADASEVALKSDLGTAATKNVANATNDVFDKVVYNSNDGVTEIAQHLDFHKVGSTTDYDFRMSIDSSGNPTFNGKALPVSSGGTGSTGRAAGLTNLLNGGGITSATNTDWNNVTYAGIYRVTSTTAGTNGPTDVYGFGHLLVVNLDSSITQVFISHHHEIMVRQSWNGGGEDTSIYWTNWSKVAINISSGTSEPPSSGTAGSVYIQYSE